MKKFIPVILFSTLFIACNHRIIDQTSSETDIPTPEDQSQVEEHAELFIEDETEYVCSMNDTKYIKPKGCTIWCIENENNEEVFEEITASIYKQSGKPQAGYGIVFLGQTINEKEFLMTVMINISGYYNIGKIIDGHFYSISKWCPTRYLQKGYGVTNKLKISHSNNKFILSINGNEVYEFRLEEKISFKGSKSGYVAVISPEENFPAESVTVVYKK